MTWTSAQGVTLRDLVPAADRRRWVAAGHCPDVDLFSLYCRHEAADPYRPAVVTAAGTVNRAELGERARRLAGTLRDAGHGRTDVVGVRIPNGIDAVVAELAVAALGAVALPIPCGRGHRDTASLLRRSRAGALLTTDPAAVRGLDLPDLRTVLAPDARGDAVRAGPVDAEAPARILVSSGSEHEPKMVAYSHNAVGGGRGNYAAALYGDTAEVRALVLVPLSSSYGSLGLVTLVRQGGTLVLLERFEPAAALAAVDRYRPTHLLGVPTMLRRMAELPTDADTSSLRTVVSSAAALAPETDAAVRARFGCPVVNVYGSSDGVNCHTARGGAGVGFPDPAVAAVRLGADGEIQCRGPMTPLCYVGAPELDAAYRLPGGWVRSGDRGRFDADGSLHVVERIRQVVIRGGYTISPAEVERLIGGHPAVSDVACVPVPDPDLGERLCACVVARNGVTAPDLAELTAFLTARRGLEPRKLPEHLLVLDALPLGPTGKVCRHTLTRLAAGTG
ncbi:class I adenylate-forming enzyme family protein [Actinocatenispora rupis]|uniref:Long-chain acyl-CoA synthetase n=1 Tax=Actinocatenispora rupis TaxID=519421 RepID=A0A8J3JCC2_9ACTN|nr:fatty acid--CoA ligase family protein [Actinocatenispora rupis]GID15736.1 long-chain acyl-CoA synthetase [Actinocatenispora rupis]